MRARGACSAICWPSITCCCVTCMRRPQSARTRCGGLGTLPVRARVTGTRSSLSSCPVLFGTYHLAVQLQLARWCRKVTRERKGHSSATSKVYEKEYSYESRVLRVVLYSQIIPNTPATCGVAVVNIRSKTHSLSDHRPHISHTDAPRPGTPLYTAIQKKCSLVPIRAHMELQV